MTMSIWTCGGTGKKSSAFEVKQSGGKADRSLPVGVQIKQACICMFTLHTSL
jgi:hypothetical protein